MAITTQELTEWLLQESQFCAHVAELPYIATNAEQVKFWRDKAEYCQEASQRLSVFEDIIRHAWIHSGYKECGRREMATEQKAAFDAVVANAKLENDRE